MPVTKFRLRHLLTWPLFKMQVKTWWWRARQCLPSFTNSESVVDAAVMFTEVFGINSSVECHGRDKENLSIPRYTTVIKESVERNGGYVVQAMGEDLLAHFPTANAALTAATEMQKNIQDEQLAKPNVFALRIGLAYGQVTIQQNDLHGTAVDIAAEMCSVAKPNQIVASIQLKENSSLEWQSRARNFPFERGGVMGGFAVCEICSSES